jgi:hypothetical protein
MPDDAGDTIEQRKRPYRESPGGPQPMPARTDDGSPGHPGSSETRRRARARIGGWGRPQTIGLQDAHLALVRKPDQQRAQELIEPGRAMALDAEVPVALT